MTEVSKTSNNEEQNNWIQNEGIKGNGSAIHKTDGGSYGTTKSAIDSYNYVTHQGPTIQSPLLLGTSHSISLAPTQEQALFLALTSLLVKLLHSLEKKNIEGESHSLQFTLRLGNMKKKLQIELGNLRAAKHITAAVGSFASAGISAGAMGATMSMKSNFNQPSTGNKQVKGSLGGNSSANKPGDSVNPANNQTDNQTAQTTDGVEISKSNQGGSSTSETITVREVKPAESASSTEAQNTAAPANSSQVDPSGQVESKPQTTNTTPDDQVEIQKAQESKKPDNAGTADQDKNLQVEKNLQTIRDIQMGADMLKELTRVATESTQAYLETVEGQLNAQMEVLNTWQSVNGVFGDDFKKAIEEYHRNIKETLDMLSNYTQAETQAIRTASSAG